MNEQKPRHVESAEMLARRSGLSGSQLLDKIQALALSPDYPTPDCFLPNEIWDYERTRTMPKERLAHADECVNCSALLSALSPDPLLTEEVASLAVSRYSGLDDRAHPVGPKGHKRSRVAAMAAVAAMLLIGFTLMSWRLTSSGSMNVHKSVTQSSALASALFTVTNADNKAQLSIPVKMHADGRLQQESYSTAAAATALVSSPVLAAKEGDRDLLLDDPSATHLRILLVSALADACENSKQQVDVRGLEHRLRNARLTVQSISSSNDQLLIKYGPDSVTLKPDEALLNTMQYCTVLARSKGDTRALDQSLQNVDINLAAVKHSSSPE